MKLLDYARSLRDIGLSVFRIPRGTKVPNTSWKHLQDRLATDDELVAWFRDEPANLGIVTGAISGIVVIDLDDEAATQYLIRDRHLPSTPWRTRTSRGWHLWFAHPGEPVANRGTDLLTPRGPLPIHLRGDGGYVLAGGSLHPSGALYRTTVRPPRAALPRFSPTWLASSKLPKERASVPAPPPAFSGDAFLLERARRYLAAIPPPIIGAGSDALTLKAACRLVRGFELLPGDAEALLWEWAGNREGWDREWIAAKVRNADRYGREVVGGLR